MEVLKAAIKKSTNKPNEKLYKQPAILICFSHLRWDFVYQRPQHLLSRFANNFSVFFVEEPLFENIEKPFLIFVNRADNLFTVTPHIPSHTAAGEAIAIQKDLLNSFLKTRDLSGTIFWYYTPMALSFSGHYKPSVVVYDCMDELSNFKNAPPELKQYEAELFDKADLVFTGGHSLFSAKKHLHKNIFPFPSSIDKSHFVQARSITNEPVDQQHIPYPRLGFYGVIDERFDLDLIENIALQKPEWNLVILGPVVKIDPASLPKYPNIHYLGSKSYSELPAYLSNWDVALIPFLLNEATRFISPTKTPEYLAAGVPVISTPISDVVRPYGEDGLVKIAATANEFIDAAEELLQIDLDKWTPAVDDYLSKQSWDLTFGDMMEKIKGTLIKKQL